MRTFYRIKNFFEEIPISIRSFVQRGKRGYADTDLYDLSDYLEKLITKSVSQLESTTIGYGVYDFKEIGGFEAQWVDKNFKEIIAELQKQGYENDDHGIYDDFIKYKLILRRIAWDFKELDYWNCSEENEYSDEYNIQLSHQLKQLENEPDKYELVTRKVNKQLTKDYNKREKEIEKYREKRKQEGFKLLYKYFESLWY